MRNSVTKFFEGTSGQDSLRLPSFRTKSRIPTPFQRSDDRPFPCVALEAIKLLRKVGRTIVLRPYPFGTNGAVFWTRGIRAI
jgi:hypothetical protein